MPLHFRLCYGNCNKIKSQIITCRTLRKHNINYWSSDITLQLDKLSKLGNFESCLNMYFLYTIHLDKPYFPKVSATANVIQHVNLCGPFVLCGMLHWTFSWHLALLGSTTLLGYTSVVSGLQKELQGHWWGKGLQGWRVAAVNGRLGYYLIMIMGSWIGSTGWNKSNI